MIKRIVFYFLLISFQGFGGVNSAPNIHSNQISTDQQSPEFIIIDSWWIGFTHGLFSVKEKRLKAAFTEAKLRAVVDARIWGGLFVSDTNRSGIYRVGEVLSRFTYQIPQTAAGFMMSHSYNTFLGKVNKVQYGFGATSINMNVSWPGIAMGNYILARKIIEADPNNRMFQHEYGHYLQSKRMGFAYYVRVGLPAILSKGDHDAHPVEIDCNREGFLYFNRYIPNYQNDSSLIDAKGWNFRFNPFPDSIGENRILVRSSVQYIDAKNTDRMAEVESLKVRATAIDYVSWFVFPSPVFVGLAHAKKYNRGQMKK